MTAAWSRTTSAAGSMATSSTCSSAARAYYLGLSGSGGSHAWARHVPVFDGCKICERKGRVVTKKVGAI